MNLRPAALGRVLCLLLSACATATVPAPPPATAPVAVTSLQPGRCGQAEPWPEADALFRSDPRWRGGDAAYSIDLGDGRSLWLFGDSFIQPSGEGGRAGAHFVRNSLAIMDGPDPSSASLRFHWRTDEAGRAQSFFAEQGEHWYWPSHGVRLESGLLLFMYRVRHDPDEPSALAFRVEGSEAFLIPNPEQPPPRWQLRRLALKVPAQVGLTGVSVLLVDDQLQVFGAGAEPPHPAYLLRFAPDAFAGERTEAPEHWQQGQSGFGRGPPAVLFDKGATEFSVHRQPGLERYLQVQSRGFGAAPVSLRYAKAPWGPWSEPQDAFTPQVSQSTFAYAAKAHPQLRGADLVVSYVINSMAFDELVQNESLYYPRFLRLRCAGILPKPISTTGASE